MSGLVDQEGTAPIEEGTRFGRFVTLRDNNGILHAVAASSVAAICEADDGTIVLLPGGRVLQLDHSLRTVLSLLEVGIR